MSDHDPQLCEIDGCLECMPGPDQLDERAIRADERARLVRELEGAGLSAAAPPVGGGCETRCPRCNSPEPHLHPAVQFEGEVQPCNDSWHGQHAGGTVFNADRTVRHGLGAPASDGEGRAAAGGVELIAAERCRQVQVEGYDEAHDDAHAHDEMAQAAAAYAWPSDLSTRDGRRVHRSLLWPWHGDGSWKPGDRVGELVKAGALIAAEIDRLLRVRELTKETR